MDKISESVKNRIFTSINIEEINRKRTISKLKINKKNSEKTEKTIKYVIDKALKAVNIKIGTRRKIATLIAP